MSQYFNQKRVAVSVLPTPTGTAGGPVDFNATGDKFILTLPVPIDIYRYGLITIDAMDPDAGGFVLALDHRVTVGSDTGRTEFATITRADAETVAAGGLVYHNLVEEDTDGTEAVDGSLVFSAGDGPLHVDPGEEVVIEVTNAVGAASTGYVWIEYVQLPFNEHLGAEEVA